MLFFFYKDLTKEELFGHHANLHDNHLITWYDENYNKRQRPVIQSLPSLRSWDKKSLCWAPERSDYPIKGKCVICVIFEGFFKKNYGVHPGAWCGCLNFIDFYYNCLWYFSFVKVFQIYLLNRQISSLVIWHSPKFVIKSAYITCILTFKTMVGLCFLLRPNSVYCMVIMCILCYSHFSLYIQKENPLTGVWRRPHFLGTLMTCLRCVKPVTKRRTKENTNLKATLDWRKDWYNHKFLCQQYKVSLDIC